MYWDIWGNQVYRTMGKPYVFPKVGNLFFPKIYRFPWVLWRNCQAVLMISPIFPIFFSSTFVPFLHVRNHICCYLDTALPSPVIPRGYGPGLVHSNFSIDGRITMPDLMSGLSARIPLQPFNLIWITDGTYKNKAECSLLD